MQDSHNKVYGEPVLQENGDISIEVPVGSLDEERPTDSKTKKRKPRAQRTETRKSGTTLGVSIDNASKRSGSKKSSIMANPMLEEDQQAISKEPLMPDIANDENEIINDPSKIWMMYNMATGTAVFPIQLQREAVVHFHFAAFVTEAVIHLFQPICIPLLFLFLGPIPLWNRQFLVGPAMVQMSILVCYVAANVIFFVMRPANISVYEIVLLNASWLLRNMVIASKWAYMSPTELVDLWTTYVPYNDLRNKQIISGWTVPSQELLEHQLLLSCVRQKMDLKKYLFEVVDEENTAPEELMSKEATKRHTAYAVALQLVIDSVREYGNAISIMFFTCVTLAVCHSLVPTFVRAILRVPVFGGLSYNEWAPYVFFFCAAYVNSFLMFSNSAFTVVGLVDFKRRVYCAEKLNHLISHAYVRTTGNLNKFRQDDASAEDVVTSSLHIDLSRPVNTLGWFAVRQVIRDFGLPYYRRINAYASFFLMYILGLVLTIILALIVPSVIPLDATLVVFVIFDVNVFMALIFLLVLAGSSVNNYNRSHAWHCALKQFEVLTMLQDNAGKMAPERQEQLRAASILLSTAVECIAADNRLNQVTILGFEASGQFAGTFAAVAGTGIAAAADGISKAFFL